MSAAVTAAAEQRRFDAGIAVLRQVASRPAGALGLALTLFIVVVAILAGVIAPGDPFALKNPALLTPSGAHFFGTDNLGRDMFRAVVNGLRTSMSVVLWVTVISAVIGLGVGAVAGYRGGLVERTLMRLTEYFQSIPSFFLALLALALLGRTLQNLILVLGLTSWTLLARVVRADALSLRSREYVTASRSFGASATRVLLRHIIPNLLPSALVVISLNASRVILIEAGLAYLGLGDPNQMSLGFLIFNAQQFLQQAWWMSVFPGLAILVAVLGINLLADALNDILDPLVKPGLGDPHTVNPEPDVRYPGRPGFGVRRKRSG
jgi:peptide/nickel transport system permease protein